MDKAEAIRLLEMAADQVSTIIDLIDEQDRCIDVIQRLQAVQAELHEISLALLDTHFTVCVATAAVHDHDLCRQALADIGDVFCYANRLGLRDRQNGIT